MSQEEADQKAMVNWQPRVIIIAVILGAIVGGLAGYLYTREEPDPTVKPDFSSGDIFKLGLTLLGVVRAVAGLGAPGK